MQYTDFDLGSDSYALRIVDAPDNTLKIYLSPMVRDPNPEPEIDDNPAIQALLATATKMMPSQDIAWEVQFDEYLSYWVTNESYCLLENQKAKRAGITIQLFGETDFLASVKTNTLYDAALYHAKHSDKTTLYHFRIVTCRHIIDVATFNEPSVNRVDRR